MQRFIRETLIPGTVLLILTLSACDAIHLTPAPADTTVKPPSQTSTIDPAVDPDPDPAAIDASALTFNVSRALCCDRLSYRFEADLSGTSIPEDATFLWRFGDNRTKTGSPVEHTYAWALDYVVTLTVETPDDQVYVVERMLMLSVDGEPQMVDVPATPEDPITPESTNNPPTAMDRSETLTGPEAVLLTLTADDADGDELTFWIVSHPAYGTLDALDNTPWSTATVTYTPDSGVWQNDSFTFQVGDGTARSNVATFSIRMCEPLPITPWVECTSPDTAIDASDPSSPTILEVVVQGLQTWKHVTNTAIVSTVVGQADLYPTLQGRVPGMTFIPGVKTSSALEGSYRFDDVSRWRILASEITAICAAAGQNRIVIENELALEGYYAGVEEIDFDQLRLGLAELPADIEYLWYPSAVGTGETLERYLALDAVVEEMLNVRFIDHASLNAPYAWTGPITQQTVADLESLAGLPTIPMIYMSSGKWAYDELHVALDYVTEHWGGDTLDIVYPGIELWQEAADSITAQPCRNP